MSLRTLLFFALLLFVISPAQANDAPTDWVVYQGGDGPGQGKHIVLISGDDEYRSEEALPQLGKILATHHGFTCTVLFAIDPETGHITPDHQSNIPGLEALADADLMLIATRFRDLPDEQMTPIDAYLRAGKPVVGLRTATHAFHLRTSETYKRYSWRNNIAGWEGGFGRQVLGETWIAHHGKHGKESTRGIVPESASEHPVVRGIEPGTIWGDSDVYRVRLPLPGDSVPVVLGAVLAGMSADDPPIENNKNQPMMPLAWVKTYSIDEGPTGRVFTTTLGAATDLVAQGSRRMVVQGVYWALGLEDAIPADGANVDLVGTYEPTAFGFGVYPQGVKPSDHAMPSK